MTALTAEYHRQILPRSTSPTVWRRNSCCADEFAINANQAYRILKRQDCKRPSSAPNLDMSTKKEFSRCLHALENTVPNPGTVTGCTSASFRAVPLHGIVTLSNRSYHRTNLYACRQIAFWIKAKSSPKQCSTFQTRCRRSLSFGSSTRSAMPDTNLTARYFTPDHALHPLPPCISHTNMQTISAHRRVGMLDMAPSRLELVDTCHVPSSVTLNPRTRTSKANMSAED